MNKKPKIILDTDPGGDDIFALLWLQSLVRQNLAEIVAITTAQGNVEAEVTFACASQVMGLLGLESSIPLGKGVICQQLEIGDAAYIHGNDGMGGLSGTLPKSQHNFEIAPAADEVIIEQLSASPGQITIIAIAPLTNLAAAEEKCPGILKLAKEIIIMGGAFQVPGNVTANAEFNIGFNPEAAEIVFQSRTDIVVLPLDITNKLIFTPEMAVELTKEQQNHSISKFVMALTEFMTKTSLVYRQTEGKNGFLIHDAATIAYLFYPETLLLQRGNVEIELNGKLTKGQTFLDHRHFPKSQSNSWVALEVDNYNLLACFIEDLKHL
ncbi:nucleoside hydrolase [Calothrix sp. PCC 6303]|uniref:nucleoside hydrolase n=1 Tax=Calothrix sp. PCC 6303 TaxID=1170562 RepID=UPI0002A01876|nr:nucleoside hydrolase [Calothrix sp. PCC 6303]AFZ00796.1 Inosine/uridine-preferring nucleoside hydrolase [Calothrix sp. PCC 6303]